MPKSTKVGLVTVLADGGLAALLIAEILGSAGASIEELAAARLAHAGHESAELKLGGFVQMIYFDLFARV